MRHRVASNHFNRDSSSRKALFKNLLRELVEHGQITTTLEKAKAIKSLADKVVHKALVDSVATRRTLHRFFGRRDVVNSLVERVAPASKGRSSGFTTLTRAGIRRGDNAQLAMLKLIDTPARMGDLKKATTKASAKPKK